MKKRWTALLLAAAMLLALAACGGAAAPAQPEASAGSAAEIPEPTPEPTPEAVPEPAPEAPAEEPAASAEEEPEEAPPEDVTGTYHFDESAMNGAFTVPWTLELRADGTYTITEENPFMGTLTYEGEYTYGDGVVTTGPFEGEPPVADFFAEDKSCQWRLEGEGCVPVNYTGGETATASEDGLTNIAYGDLSASQVLDLHLPAGEGPFPVIVLLHGGGFLFGDQRMPIIQPVIDAAVAKGYAVASVDYRKSSEAIFPAALSDVKAAMRFLRKNAGEYGIDPEQVVLWGESAGAYLALMTALTPEVAELNGDMTENLEQSSAVTALVDFYGPVEFFTMDEEMGNTEPSFATDASFESQFLGQNLGADRDKTYTTYWETYKDQLPAGFTLKAWVQVGDSDARVPCTQSEHFAERLGAVIGPENVAFSFIPGADHEDDLFYTQENLDAVFAFLDEALGR